MMIMSIETPRRPFYLLWVLVTLLGVAIAFFLNLIILRLIIFFVGDFIYMHGVRRITEDYLWGYTFIPIVGLLTGMLQYQMLRRYLPDMGWWVAATTGGWLVGAFLILLPGWINPANPLLSLDLAFLIMGLSIGAVQWLLLRRRLPRAGWWIGAHVAGWGLLALITKGDSFGQLGLLALGLLPACATALTLSLLMKQIRSDEP